MSAPKVPQRVILLYRGVRPGVELLALLGDDRAVSVIKAPPELSRGGPPADVVIVDVPAEDRRAVCEQVRHHYHGPLIVLLQPADNSHDLPSDRNRTLLTRPFSLRELTAAVATSAPAPPASDPAGRPGPLLPHGAQDPGPTPIGGGDAVRSHKPSPGSCQAGGSVAWSGCRRLWSRPPWPSSERSGWPTRATAAHHAATS